MFAGFDQADYSYTTVNLMLYGGAEITITILGACVPALRPLYVKAIRTSNRDSHSYPKLNTGTNRRKGEATAAASNSWRLEEFNSGLGGGKSRGTTRTTAVGLDNSSEENILGPEDIRVRKDLEISVENGYSMKSAMKSEQRG